MAPKADDIAAGITKLSLKTTDLDQVATKTTTAPRSKAQKKSSPVADSWEDEADNDSDNSSDAEQTPIANANTQAGTSAPPPTPLSPLAASSSRTPFSPTVLTTNPSAFGLPSSSSPSSSSSSFDGAGGNSKNNTDPLQWYSPSGPGGGGQTGNGRDSSSSSSRRPEKTDAVARRMIASALGMKAPRMTDEQRAYDRAVREKERKRREEEKERERKREEEIVKARQAIWDGD
ncbi:hypothetical protein VTK26DRAFT_8776 [Humicola hyalothermophila]